MDSKNVDVTRHFQLPNVKYFSDKILDLESQIGTHQKMIFANLDKNGLILQIQGLVRIVKNLYHVITDLRKNKGIPEVDSKLEDYLGKYNRALQELQGLQGEIDLLHQDYSQVLLKNTALVNQVNDLIERIQQLEGNRQDLVNNVTEECVSAKDSILELAGLIQHKLDIYTSLVEKVQNDKVKAKLVTTFQDFVDQYAPLFAAAKEATVGVQAAVTCREITTKLQSLIDIQTTLLSIDDTLTNLYEDIIGSVRVYLRVRPTVSNTSSIDIQGSSVEYTCGDTTKTFGRFFGVIPSTYTNEDSFSTSETCDLDGIGLCRVTNQLSSGYHIVLSGYGLSGSGKTRTLLGNSAQRVPGLVHLAVEKSGAQKVTLVSVYELAMKNIDFRDKKHNVGKIVNLYGDHPILSPTDFVVQNEFRGLVPFLERYDLVREVGNVGAIEDLLKDRNLSTVDIFNLTLAITDYRLQQGRIKATINNPESSRSHLFMTLRFEFANGKTGLLTVLDMGGREDSFEILDSLLEKPDPTKKWNVASTLLGITNSSVRPHTFTVSDPKISWFVDQRNVSPEYRKQLEAFISDLNESSHDPRVYVELIKESIFINETVNQLIYFFKEKQGTQERIQSNKWPMSDPRSSYDPHKFISSPPNDSEKIGMYHVLSALDNLEKKQTKFVTIVCLRQEPKYCLGTLASLEFAQTIKST